MNLLNLKFRRQFVIGPKIFMPSHEWRHIRFSKKFILSFHPELSVHVKSNNYFTAAIIGTAIDPFNPGYHQSDILNDIITRSVSFQDCLKNTFPISGRWCFIFFDEKNLSVFTDPCGLRSVFFARNEHGVWCGSQPEIINEASNVKSNIRDDIIPFITSKKFAIKEGAWIGHETFYKNGYHLLPNHYINLKNLNPIRFFPMDSVQIKNEKCVIDIAEKILKGTMKSLIYRYQVLFALTSGLDSRVLLAATKGIHHNFLFYVDKMGVLENSAPDVAVPIAIAKRMKLNFKIENSKTPIPSWFCKLLLDNVTGARMLPKTQMIYTKFLGNNSCINVNGNASEVARRSNRWALLEKDSTVDDFTDLVGYNDNYVKGQLTNWFDRLRQHGLKGYNYTDLLYWEQRMGNWGALFPSEQDIAIEEISPFNNRMLLDCLLSSPPMMRTAPEYQLYYLLVERMWPELLKFPVNPACKNPLIKINVDRFKSIIKRVLPESIVNRIKTLF